MSLWILFLLICFPMMFIATYGLDALFLFFACRDACYQCAKSASFTEGFARANATLQRDTGAEITGATTTIVRRTLATGTETRWTWTFTPPASTSPPGNLPVEVNTDSLYVIEEVVNANIRFVVPMIPPQPLTVRFQSIVENINGLKD